MVWSLESWGIANTRSYHNVVYYTATLHSVLLNKVTAIYPFKYFSSHFVASLPPYWPVGSTAYSQQPSPFLYHMPPNYMNGFPKEPTYAHLPASIAPYQLSNNHSPLKPTLNQDKVPGLGGQLQPIAMQCLPGCASQPQPAAVERPQADCSKDSNEKLEKEDKCDIGALEIVILLTDSYIQQCEGTEA